MMPVVDEHTRECLAIEAERSITAEEVIGTTLARLFGQRGAPPAFIRSDNGPEFVARALKRWLEVSDVVGALYIEPGRARGRMPMRSRSSGASGTSC